MGEKPDRPESVLADTAPEDVFKILNTHETGLTPEEAAKAKEIYGENKIAEAKGKPAVPFADSGVYYREATTMVLGGDYILSDWSRAELPD